MTRLPIGPLLDTLGEVRVTSEMPPASWTNTDNVGSRSQPCHMSVLAELVGVSRSTIARWNRKGVPVGMADAAACALGVNPINVWGDNYDGLGA